MEIGERKKEKKEKKERKNKKKREGMKEKTRFILFVLCSNEKPPVTNGDWITAVIETGGKIRKERKKERKKER